MIDKDTQLLLAIKLRNEWHRARDSGEGKEWEELPFHRQQLWLNYAEFAYETVLGMVR